MNQKKLFKERDALYKARGFHWRAMVWVHPPYGGTKYCVDLYVIGTRANVDKEVNTLLVKKHSTVMDDFRVTSL